jgi:hypothetical protein
MAWWSHSYGDNVNLDQCVVATVAQRILRPRSDDYVVAQAEMRIQSLT